MAVIIVESYLDTIMRKIGANTILDVVHYAVGNQIVQF
jgi:hypothetical protein